MDPMDPADLERLIDRELSGLPQPRAPRTLMPRVLAATAHSSATAAAPTGWSTWPRQWQIASIAALLLVVFGVPMLVSSPPAEVTSTARRVADTATVVRAFWDLLLRPVATYVVILAVSFTLACAAAWAALEFALGGPSHR
jgi:hypothetical protein